MGSALAGHSRGPHHPLVDYRPLVDGFRVTGHGTFPYQVDGDYLGEAATLDFRYVPDALALVTP